MTINTQMLLRALHLPVAIALVLCGVGAVLVGISTRLHIERTDGVHALVGVNRDGEIHIIFLDVDPIVPIDVWYSHQTSGGSARADVTLPVLGAVAKEVMVIRQDTLRHRRDAVPPFPIEVSLDLYHRRLLERDETRNIIRRTLRRIIHTGDPGTRTVHDNPRSYIKVHNLWYVWIIDWGRAAWIPGGILVGGVGVVLLGRLGMKAWVARRRLRRGRCPTCGYHLDGNRDAPCPECGWVRVVR